MQERLIVPDDLEDTRRRNRPCVPDSNDSINPIDNTICSLRYSSIPHLLFENQSKPSKQSVKCVIQSGDGWFEDLEDARREPTIPSKMITGHPIMQLNYVPGGRHTYSQVPEIDSDTDSSSSAPSTEPDSEAEHWLHVIEKDVGGGNWEGLDGIKVQSSMTDLAVPKKTLLKGMARLRRMSPKAIKTTTSQETKHNSSRANVIIQGDIRETKKLNQAKDSLLPVASNMTGSRIDQGHIRTNRLIVMTPESQMLLDLLVHGTK